MPSHPAVLDAVEPAQTAEDLLAAAALIDRYGLDQDRYHNPVTGCFCGLGAIMEAIVPGFWTSLVTDVYLTDARRRRHDAAREALAEFLTVTTLAQGTVNAKIIQWVAKASKEQVVVAMRATAQRVLSSA